jgi:hypothetical protein
MILKVTVIIKKIVKLLSILVKKIFKEKSQNYKKVWSIFLKFCKDVKLKLIVSLKKIVNFFKML